MDVDVSEVMHLIGDVRGKPALIMDDIIDTAGTLVKTAEALLKEGATRVFAACTHPVLSGPAVERICKSPITEVVVTDSVPLSAEAQKVSKIKVLSVAELLARGIRSIHEETSISELVRCRSRSGSHESFAGRRAMEQIIVEATPREDRGKNAARRARVAGRCRPYLYGGKGGAVALSVNTKQLSAILRSESGHNTIFKVKLPTGEQAAMVKDWQVDPVKGVLLHVDLLRIAMDVRMRVRCRCTHSASRRA